MEAVTAEHITQIATPHLLPVDGSPVIMFIKKRMTPYAIRYEGASTLEELVAAIRETNSNSTLSESAAAMARIAYDGAVSEKLSAARVAALDVMIELVTKRANAIRAQDMVTGTCSICNSSA